MKRVETAAFLGRLLTLSVSDDAKASLIRLWREPLEWEPILHAASENLVTPALSSALKAVGVFDALPEDLRAYLEQIRSINKMRNQDIKEQVLGIARRFNEIGVEPIFLKGAANLFFGVYADPADRIMVDADILVPEERLFDCVRLLKEMDYRCVGNEAHFDAQAPHYPRLLSGSRQAGVELHRRTLPQKYARVYDEQDFRRDAQRQTHGATIFRLPSATDHLLHHICHAHKHFQVYAGPGQFIVRRIVDCALLCRKFGDQIVWPQIEARFASAGLRNAFASYLLAMKAITGYDEPLHHVRVGGMRKAFLHGIFFLFRHDPVFGAWQLFEQYRHSIKAMGASRRRRREFMEKLKTKDFYARQAVKVIGICRKR